jgi:peptidoglycan/LPS O-acetylase OafA/YrhL
MNEERLLPSPPHAAYIDGLRAIAVLSVIIYHLHGKWLPGGFAGVDVFFVISGFVVAMSVSELGRIGFVEFLAYFYARRLVRIAPALIVVLFTTFLASVIFIPPAWLSETNQKTGLFAFFGLSNFILAENAGGYFSPRSEFNPFTHTWSLAIEEQFYLLFPVMFFLWLRNYCKISMAIFASALLGTLICAVILFLSSDSTQAFYMIWARFWELAIGVLLFQLMCFFGHSFDEESTTTSLHHRLAGLGLVLLGAGLILANPRFAPFPSCLPAIVGAALILGSLHGRRGGFAHALLTNSVMVFIGKISYSLYLWHWSVFVLLRWTAGLESAYVRVCALILIAIFALCSYFFIEQPPRRVARKQKRKSLVIAGGFMVIAIGYGCAVVVTDKQPQISLSTVTRNRNLWYPEGDGSIRSTQGCKIKVEGMPFPGGDARMLTRSNCAHSSHPRTIFVLGDSHAMHYHSMLKQFVVDSGDMVLQYMVGGCPFISLQPWREDESCKKYGRAAVANLLPRIREGDIVFLPSLRLPRAVDQWAVFNNLEAIKQEVINDVQRQGRESSVAEAVPVLREMVNRGARIVFEAPPPIFESIPYRCADWFNRTNPICARGFSVPRKTIEELRAPVLQAYAKIRAEVANVEVWDPMPVLCPEADTVCRTSRDDKPLFFDGDHFTYFTNMLLLPSFAAHVAGKRTSS